MNSHHPPIIKTLIISQIYYSFKLNNVKNGTILVHIDPLELVRGIWLKCFGEIYQEKLYRYLRIFLDKPIEGEDFRTLKGRPKPP